MCGSQRALAVQSIAICRYVLENELFLDKMALYENVLYKMLLYENVLYKMLLIPISELIYKIWNGIKPVVDRFITSLNVFKRKYKCSTRA